MLKRYNPATIHPPGGKYSHGIETPAGARWLHVSGQVGTKPDGSTASDAAAQCEQAWANLMAVLAAAGMGAADIVKINAYVTGPGIVPAYRAARDRALGGAAPPASTLVVVAALAGPAWVVEIEAAAAQA